MTDNRRGPDLGWFSPERRVQALKSQAAMLDAAQALIFQNGVAATTVAEVAKRAGSSVSTIYRYFEDKQSMVNAVFDRIAEETLATVVALADPARWAGATVGEILDAYIRFSLSTGREQRQLRSIGRGLTDMNRLTRERFDAAERQTELGLSTLMLARQEEIGHPYPEVAVAFVLEQLATMIERRVHPEAWVGNRKPKLATYDDEEFVTEALRSVCAYLDTPLPADD
jgi:AcrR family transcriptional regulator